MLLFAEQPAASDTVTVQLPETKAETLADVALFVQLQVYGKVPPVTVAVAAPFVPPLHETFVPATDTEIGAG